LFQNSDVLRLVFMNVYYVVVLSSRCIKIFNVNCSKIKVYLVYEKKNQNKVFMQALYIHS